jgi:hypothetical protein
MSVLTVAEGSQGGRFDLMLEPSQSTVGVAGLRLVLTAPKNALPAGVLLMANDAAQAGSESKGGGEAKAKPAPKNRRKPGTTLPPGKADLRPGEEPMAEGTWIA